MLITFAGRKSGKMYTTPVNYIRDGNDITLFSDRNRVWWRNMQGGVPVIVRIKGQDLKAIGEAIEEKKIVALGLQAYLQMSPKNAKYFKVSLNPNGQPIPEEVDRAAENRVIIRVKLA